MTVPAARVPLCVWDFLWRTMAEGEDGHEFQVAELQLMEAAFGDCCRVINDSPGQIRFCIAVNNLDNKFSYDITFSLPPQYPTSAALSCAVDGEVPNLILHDINKRVQHLLQENPATACMEIYQLVNDCLNDWAENEHLKRISGTTEAICTEITIARFLIYFHHIMR